MMPINYKQKAKSIMLPCSCTNVFIILLLHFFLGTGTGTGTGVWGAKFTFVNNCSLTVWPAIFGLPKLQNTGFELSHGNSVAVQVPTGWSGGIWGRTGCTFNASGFGSCTTGSCDSQLECNSNTTAPTTLTEFSLGGPSNLDFYDVSLIDGYNLPVLVQPSRGCRSTGCAEDLIQICPSELRTSGGGACRGLCEAFKTDEYCCRGNYSTRSACQPTSYSQAFKRACPHAYTYPFDDATAAFTCTTGADYFITFCPASLAQTGVSPTQSPDFEPGIDLSQNGKNGVSTVIIIVVVAVSTSGVIIVAAIILYFLKRRRRSTSVPTKQDVENLLLQHGSQAPKRYRYSEIKKITKSFSDKLGKGGYGSVYKGKLSDGSLVAVKVLVETDSNGEEFINEVASISKTCHVNIVNLVGFCYEGNKRALVYEYMPNKSLDKFISNSGSADNADRRMDLEQLYKIAVGIAKGLEYLHTGCTTRIVHFDIKPQNILLDEDLCPKISDFGLAQLCKKKQSVLSVVGTRGTIGYIAPEVFSRNFGGVSHKSDVYSYGMMVLEMAGAGKIIEPEVIQSSENYFTDKIYEQVVVDVTAKLDDLFEEETRWKMFLVGFWCIQTNPSDRPSISKVVEMLEGSFQSIKIPPKPYLFAPIVPNQEISSSFSAHVEVENSAQD